MDINKPEYIKFIENQEVIFSVITIDNVEIKPEILDKKTFEVGYSKSHYRDKIICVEKIYKTKQNFYIYLKYDDVDKRWVNNIYYKQEQTSELNFFIKQLIKDFKNVK